MNPNLLMIGLRRMLRAALCAGPLLAQDASLLSLDDAIALARQGNRAVAAAALDQQKADTRIRVARSLRLPQARVDVIAGLLVTRPSLTFEQGVFGSYPDIGLVPAERTTVSAPRQLSALVIGQVNQPLTQLHRLNLGVRLAEVGRQISIEERGTTRRDITHAVRRAYYGILQAESGLTSLERSLTSLREAERLTRGNLDSGTALQTDLLAVQARRAAAEAQETTFRNALEGQREQFNLLLGRPLDTPFRLRPVLDEDGTSLDLNTLRERAVAARSEVRQARLRVQQADLDRRIRKAEAIPDVNLNFTYVTLAGPNQVLPRNVANVGFQATWQPFDWGRRRQEVAEREATRRQAELALTDAEEKVRIEVGDALRQWRTARAQLAANRTGQESAREALRVTELRFRQQAVLVRDVLDAQAALAAAEDSNQKALLAHASARADLARALGED